MSKIKTIPPSFFPIIASGSLLVLCLGLIRLLHGDDSAWAYIMIGMSSLVAVTVSWMVTAINDSQNTAKGQLKLVDATYRWSMFWFIFSEVWFFAGFFAVLWYARFVSVPTLGGVFGDDRLTHYILWSDFQPQWPLLQNPDASRYLGPSGVVKPWGLPLINTVILLTSGITITIAHWAVISEKKWAAFFWQMVTVMLGFWFLYYQYVEYIEAYSHLGLRLDSGIYGSVFFFLTGFHGLHVFVGSLMLLGIALRIARGHFTADRHLGFEMVSWYWHFVDVVWLLLFVLVYWL